MVPFNVAGREAGRDLPGGLVVPDLSLTPQWVRVTGRLAGKSRYAYRQIDDGSAPDFAADLGDGFGSSGTTSPKGYTAYELQGRTDVPVGAIVQAWPAGDLSYQVFRYDGQGDTGDPDGESQSSESTSVSVSAGDDSDDTDDNVTSGPVAGACVTGCGSLAGLRPDWRLLVEVVCAAGEFRNMGLSQAVALYPDGAGVWSSEDYLNWVGASGPLQFYFEAGQPVLLLNGLPLALRCFDRDATFSGGWMTGHTGDGDLVPAPCKPNDFTLRVSCADPTSVSVSSEVVSEASSDGGGDSSAPGGANCEAATDLAGPPTSWSGNLVGGAQNWWKVGVAPSTGTYYLSLPEAFSMLVGWTLYLGSDCMTKTSTLTGLGNATPYCNSFAATAGDVIWLQFTNGDVDISTSWSVTSTPC